MKDKSKIERDLMRDLLLSNYKSKENELSRFITLIGLIILFVSLFTKQWIHVIVGLIFITRINIKF